MSYSFYIKAKRAPSLAELETYAKDERWRCDDTPADTSPAAPVPSGFCVHPYLYGASTRGVEVVHEDGRLQVRIMTCSTAADHKLALALALGYAAKHDAMIEPEDSDGGLTAKSFRARFDGDWVAHQVASGPGVIAAMVDRDGGTLTMSGCRRPFHVGPRFLAALRGRGGDLEERIYAAFLYAQFVDLDEDYYASSVLSLREKDAPEATAVTLAVWAAGVRYLFPKTERLAIVAGEDTFQVPAALGPDLAGDAWRWIDEQHALVDAFDAGSWAGLVARARPHAID